MSALESTSDTTGVTFTADGNIELHLTSLPQAQLALQQLEVKKKEYWDTKKKVLEQQSQIRATYAEEDHKHASKLETGGGFGHFLAIKSVDTMHRDSDRKTLEKRLVVLDEQEETLEANIKKVDRAIRHVESYIYLNSD